MITKTSFRDQIREIIYDRLISGDLKSGQKLSLVKFAEEMNTSVTPIREAFTQLEHVGLIQSIPNVGFVVRSLSREEARDSYNLIGVLEAYAVSTSSFNIDQIKQLKEKAHKIENAPSVKDRLRWDNSYHNILVEKCDNHVLIQTLKNLKASIFLYALEYMEDNVLIKLSNNEHADIISHIEKGQISDASAMVQKHWWQISHEMNKGIK